MPTTESSPGPSKDGRLQRAAQVLIVSSVMFTFISYWRTAAVVLCDLSSTAYYIGAIVESSIGKAAPWFILAVMLFSYAMRSVYIESCSLFVRGGVYRVVKEAMGGFLAKLSVSALLFDYVLTGPISSVSAGQYIVGLALEVMSRFDITVGEASKDLIKNWGSVAIAVAITVYFFRQNLIGIPESSDKALKIMMATTVMVVIVLAWSGLTLAIKGPANDLPSGMPELTKKFQVEPSGELKKDDDGSPIPLRNPLTNRQEDPLGFIGDYFPNLAESLRDPGSWWNLVGLIGLIIAFGHSILAMSGEETLAQVYREVESPKLPNFEKAAFIVFVYSLLMTVSISFLAVLLIPEGLRLTDYKDNLIGGLAMQMIGPPLVLLLLNGFVVVVGFLILSGAVNTSIIGSNGVLNRVAEDGVLPDWFLKPHKRFGTSFRILYLITALQLITIVASQGDVLLLGEAYAFGVVWSFVFKSLAMVVLRFKDRQPREFKVPLNIRLGNVEVPIGLCLIFIIVFLSALGNLATKQVATYSGVTFTAAFLVVFMITEHINERRHRGHKAEHLEQFNMETTQAVSNLDLGLSKPFRRLVSIRSPHNLFMLERTLAETDPSTTDVIVMTAKVVPPGGEAAVSTQDLDVYDQHLMTAVVERAEKAGKKVKPLIVPTNNALHAVLKTAKDLHAQELVLGASNKFTAEEQLDQIAFYWISLHDGHTPPLTVRILSRDRDVYFDLEGGNRIPKIGERQARSVAELRAAGVGVDRVLLVHDGTPASADLFRWVLTILDPEVALDLAQVGPEEHAHLAPGALTQDREQAQRLGRKLEVLVPQQGDPGPELVRLAREGHYDLIVIGLPEGRLHVSDWPGWTDYILSNAHCPIFLAVHPLIPKEVVQ
jgi:amino acid transporter/nucleotide-binding universal stress UspA family protein